MLYYPQLTTGALSQFPVTRSTNMRTISNQLAERLHDPDGRHRLPEGSMAAPIFESHRRRAVRHRKSVRSVRRSTEYVYFLRSHRQSIDVERGLDPNGVDGRSAVAGDGRRSGSTGGSDAMQAHEHRANDATDYSKHKRAQAHFCTATACMSGAMCPRQFSWL